jgi:hypothetical protein
MASASGTIGTEWLTGPTQNHKLHPHTSMQLLHMPGITGNPVPSVCTLPAGGCFAYAPQTQVAGAGQTWSIAERRLLALRERLNTHLQGSWSKLTHLPAVRTVLLGDGIIPACAVQLCRCAVAYLSLVQSLLTAAVPPAQPHQSAADHAPALPQTAMTDLKGKVALVTGATSGIGAVTAEHLAGEDPREGGRLLSRTRRLGRPAVSMAAVVCGCEATPASSGCSDMVPDNLQPRSSGPASQDNRWLADAAAPCSTKPAPCCDLCHLYPPQQRQQQQQQHHQLSASRASQQANMSCDHLHRSLFDGCTLRA